MMKCTACVASQTRNNLATLRGQRFTAGILITAVSLLCCHDDKLHDVSVIGPAVILPVNPLCLFSKKEPKSWGEALSAS